jgi:hypothetical protein
MKISEFNFLQIMKQNIFLLLFLPMILFSCSSDSKEEEQEPESIDLVGVWKSGDYFISFSEDKFYTAYLNDKFIDSGDYVISQEKKLVTCKNTYNNKTTRYDIVGCENGSLVCKATYINFEGEEVTENFSLKKSNSIPSSKEHILIGKLYRYLAAGYGDCIMKFDTFNTATLSTDEYRPKVQNWYYIYLDSNIYFQRFAPAGSTLNSFYANCGSGDVNIYRINVSSNGLIESFDVLK